MNEPILQIKSLAFSYKARRVLFDISLQIPSGIYLSLVGPNGSGKSTLLRLLRGAVRPEAGYVHYLNRDVSRMNDATRAQHFAVVCQNEQASFPFSCLEMVLLGLHPHRSRFGRPTATQLERVRDAMRRTGTLALAAQPVTQVSGGEYQRVALARALVQAPRVLFLDEAMSSLDIGARIEMTHYLRMLVRGTGLTVIAVNHDLATAYRFSDYVAALNGGRIFAFGTPQEVMDNAFFTDLFGVQAEIFPGKGFFIRDCISNADKLQTGKGVAR